MPPYLLSVPCDAISVKQREQLTFGFNNCHKKEIDSIDQTRYIKFEENILNAQD